MQKTYEAIHLKRECDGGLLVSREPIIGGYTTPCLNVQEMIDSPGLAEKTYGHIVDGVSAKVQSILTQRRLLNKRK